jgi:hypothetical protein
MGGKDGESGMNRGEVGGESFTRAMIDNDRAVGERLVKGKGLQAAPRRFRVPEVDDHHNG